MSLLNAQQESALCNLLTALIDQHKASVLVPPYAAEPGFWFGGGNVVQDKAGVFWLCGRYRNYGDSRTGLEVGQRGLECALFRSDDGGQTFHKIISWSKATLSQQGDKVLSIEGTSLHQRTDGSWELYISSEKEQSYPEPLASYQKAGTGVWSIDRIHAPSIPELQPDSLTQVLINHGRPEYLHVKDPVTIARADGSTELIFCSHPYTWSSSNSGLAVRGPGNDTFTVQQWEIGGRGPTWDVAATRITAHMPLPPLGVFANTEPFSVYFYDGAECLRDHEENIRAHKRPRGYSCEEIGGAFVSKDATFPALERLSRLEPLFVSPWGTGCSRYTRVLTTDKGLFATWQQGQADGSQPFVGHLLSWADIEQLLTHG